MYYVSVYRKAERQFPGYEHLVLYLSTSACNLVFVKQISDLISLALKLLLRILNKMVTASTFGLRLASLPGAASQLSTRSVLHSEQKQWLPKASMQMSTMQFYKPRMSTLDMLCDVYRYVCC